MGPRVAGPTRGQTPSRHSAGYLTPPPPAVFGPFDLPSPLSSTGPGAAVVNVSARDDDLSPFRRVKFVAGWRRSLDATSL